MNTEPQSTGSVLRDLGLSIRDGWRHFQETRGFRADDRSSYGRWSLIYTKIAELQVADTSIHNQVCAVNNRLDETDDQMEDIAADVRRCIRSARTDSANRLEAMQRASDDRFDAVESDLSALGDALITLQGRIIKLEAERLVKLDVGPFCPDCGRGEDEGLDVVKASMCDGIQIPF